MEIFIILRVDKIFGNGLTVLSNVQQRQLFKADILLGSLYNMFPKIWYPLGDWDRYNKDIHHFRRSKFSETD